MTILFLFLTFVGICWSRGPNHDSHCVYVRHHNDYKMLTASQTKLRSWGLPSSAINNMDWNKP